MPFSTSEIRSIVNNIEKTFPVADWVVGDIHVWPLLRVRLYMDLFYQGRTGTPESGKVLRIPPQARAAVGILETLGKSAYHTAADHRMNDSAGTTADFLFLTYATHRTFLKDAWYDKYCDPFIDALGALGKRCLLLEMAIDGRYATPRHSRSIFIQPRLEILRLVNMFFRPGRSRWEERLPMFEEYSDLLRSEYPGIPGHDLAYVRTLTGLVLEYSAYFLGILRTVKPKCVFIADYYSIYGSAMIHASRRFGAKTIDIQHGLQGSDHLAYGSFEKVPENGYEVLPSIFWVWGDYEFQTISAWSGNTGGAHQPYLGSNLWVNQWRDDGNPIVRHYDEILGQIKARAGYRNLILFTPSLDSDLKEWIFEAVRLCPVNYHWLIRVHPCKPGQRRIAKKFLEKYSLWNAEVDLATDLPLPALLRHVDANISSFSTTVCEAEDFGVPSILTDPSGTSLFPRQIASGTAVTAYSPQALLAALEAQVGKKRAPSHLPSVRSCSNEDKIREFLSRHLGCPADGASLAADRIRG